MVKEFEENKTIILNSLNSLNTESNILYFAEEDKGFRAVGHASLLFEMKIFFHLLRRILAIIENQQKEGEDK